VIAGWNGWVRGRIVVRIAIFDFMTSPDLDKNPTPGPPDETREERIDFDGERDRLTAKT